MDNGHQLHSPALIISLIALFVALGGSVYAATRISGKAIKLKSLPGNRLKLHSVAANRLKPGILPAGGLRGGAPSRELTGADINEITLAQVPNAVHADTADTAQSAQDAQTAVNAVNAINADTVNGHSAGCLAGTEPFAGACWEKSARTLATTAPAAAAECASHGGTLPEALQLVAFSEVPGMNLDTGGEWSSDIPVFSGLNTYGVLTVSSSGDVNSAVSTSERRYRCVFPIVI
jgi:hypothetical protein